MTDETSSRDTADQADLQVGLETMADGTLRRWVIVRHASVWHPPTDVYERDQTLIVMVEIAGMRDGDFAVTLQGQRLIISGARQRLGAADSAYHQLEIQFGEFRTEVSLPWPVAREEVSATYRDGFLRVELPHAPTQKVQIVNVDLDDESAQDAPED
jgi:HSP20 family protein